ncbi:hypothetical protein Val02_41240 [Virgisporangium aliadipatigenens]|uniref:Uncharacterized protein n=1 Tax=Virgisporangium aliadipatigenens TaxID=741659 RepID=A0A8J3YNC3_9ACTN|nr:hypothetical protein [Virgisporangium aliadipatigenens]GIJ47238.1 hypothetical protein Val02_41240 [Virgisporangium aliadipatigenens]
MSAVRLKRLLRERHWQTYKQFCREYDRAARSIDPKLVGGYPTAKQLYRWTSGLVKGLPFAVHCEVLERMFPGETAQSLFAVDTPTDTPSADVVVQVCPGCGSRDRIAANAAVFTRVFGRASRVVA